MYTSWLCCKRLNHTYSEVQTSSGLPTISLAKPAHPSSLSAQALTSFAQSWENPVFPSIYPLLDSDFVQGWRGLCLMSLSDPPLAQWLFSGQTDKG